MQTISRLFTTRRARGGRVRMTPELQRKPPRIPFPPLQRGGQGGVVKSASFNEKTDLPTKSFFWCAFSGHKQEGACPGADSWKIVAFRRGVTFRVSRRRRGCSCSTFLRVESATQVYGAQGEDHEVSDGTERPAGRSRDHWKSKAKELAKEIAGERRASLKQRPAIPETPSRAAVPPPR